MFAPLRAKANGDSKLKINVVYGAKGKWWKSGHKGIDLLGDTAIYATGIGTVSVVDYDKNGWGWYVSIIPEGKKSYREIFCHLKEGSIKVKKGDKVSQYTRIGTMGATGNASGVHLHYEVRKNGVSINAATYLGFPNKEGYYDVNYGLPIEGWYFEDKQHRYYRNGKYVTGWQTIGENLYWFNKKGYMHTGELKNGKYIYVFGKDGVFIKRKDA